jgi:hypothetical protein
MKVKQKQKKISELETDTEPARRTAGGADAKEGRESSPRYRFIFLFLNVW